MPVGSPGISTRNYEKDNGFVSGVVAVIAGPPFALLWGTASTDAVNPSGGGRTSGQSTTIYTMVLENNTGAVVTAWLEISDGTVITPNYHVNNGESAVITFAAGLTVGDQDLYINAALIDVTAQIIGTEA